MSFRKLFLFIMLLMVSSICLAQPGGGGNPGGGEPVPIPGLELLLIAGGMLGLWRLRRKKV